MAEQRLRVTNRMGLHARAAASLVKVASQFQSSLTLQRLDGDVKADAKSILSILMLAATRGSELQLVANGVDERDALSAIVDLFAREFDETESLEPDQSNEVASQELRVRGLGVSPGVVIGRVVRLQDGTHNVYRAQINETDVEREQKRLRAAVRKSRRQLETIKERAERELGRGHAHIFDAHLLFLQDAKLTRDVEDYIIRERANAEWATKVVGDRLLSVYAGINDEFFRERGADLDDVIQRLLANLIGEDRTHLSLSEDAVIVSPDLLPSTIAELDLARVKGIATDAGGWTSHMSIIARALGLTAVVGLRDFYQKTRTGDHIIVDAHVGDVILNPLPATVAEYQFTSELIHPEPGETSFPNLGPTITQDGVTMVLRANVELPAEFEAVGVYGASGVGLFRSEFLLSRPGLMLSEEDQYKAYCSLAAASGEDGAVVRLFDVGGEAGRDTTERPQPNPALGLRAIRFNLRHKQVMRTQVRAILRAAAVGKLSLVIPMIADVADVRMAKRVIAEQLAELAAAGMPFSAVRIGAMIEVPSAVLTAEKIAREVDFFELGTNDLVQYTLAVDRGNDDVALWFRTLHPAVLYGIKRTLDAAREAGIQAIVCGEMASTPAYSVLLVGLGALELSMAPTSIPRIRSTLSRVDASTARTIAEACLDCATADEVEEIVRTEFIKHWPEVFPAKALPARYAES